MQAATARGSMDSLTERIRRDERHAVRVGGRPQAYKESLHARKPVWERKKAVVYQFWRHHIVRAAHATSGASGVSGIPRGSTPGPLTPLAALVACAALTV